MILRTSARQTLLQSARRSFLLVLLLLAALCQHAVSQPTDEEAAGPVGAQELLVITVKGRFSGPPLWKVSKGDHVLWIFPYLSPIPEGLDWDSAQVAQALAESQEYLPLPRLDGKGIPRRLLLNPDDKKLGDVLPPALYERYLGLKAEHFPRNRSLERLRPLIAAPNLLSGMYKRSGLTAGDAILRKIASLARRNRGLKVTAISNSVADDLYERLYAENHDLMPSAQEFACFEKSLDRVLTDVNVLTRRANAWAEGDMASLRETFAILAAQNADKSCAINRTTDSAANAEFQAGINDHFEQWLDAAETALSKHASTFAVLDAGMLLQADGILALLRSKGYTVREPD